MGLMEVTVMSLSGWEQQALDSIEGGLAGSDPELVSLLATFARLASGEEMPVHEEIRVLGRRATRRPLRNRRPRRGNVRRDGRSLRLGWQQTILLLGLAVTIALVAVALVLSRGSRNGSCPEGWGAVICTQQAPAHSPRPTAHNTAAGQVLLTDAIIWLTPTPPDRSSQTRRPKPAGTGPGFPLPRPAGPWLLRAVPGGLAQRQARSARVQALIRDGRHVDDSLAPIWAKLNDEDLRRDLREVTSEIRPGWDLSAPGPRAAWDAGDHARHHPYQQADHTRGPAEALFRCGP
jgi:hypothetical protein